MPHDLPPAIRLHVSDTIRRTNWDLIADQIGDLCTGCPGLQADENDLPCYDCPLWGLRLDLAQLRLLRRLELGADS